MLYSLTVYKAHGVVELEHPGSLHVKRPSQRTKSELYSPMDIATSLAREVRAPLPNLDTIYLRNLRLSANVGPDAWGRFGKSQPIVINLQLHLDTSKSGASDDLQHSFSYGQMYKDVITTIDGKDLTVICGIRQSICEVASKWPGNSIHCSITLPKSLLGVDEGLGLHFQITRPAEKGWKFSGAQWSIKGLKTACIIGLNEHERHEKQTVNVDVEFLEDYESWFRRDAQPDNWRGLVKTLHEMIENSAFGTLEALAALVARTCLENNNLPWVEVMVEKPSALAHADASGVKISRSRQDLGLPDI